MSRRVSESCTLPQSLGASRAGLHRPELLLMAALDPNCSAVQPNELEKYTILRRPRADQYVPHSAGNSEIARERTMRKLTWIGLTAAIQLCAADPRVGSWTLVSAQSAMNPARTLSIASLRNGVHVVISGDIHIDFTATWDGHEASVQGTPAFNQIELRRINKYQAEIKEKKD